MSARRAPRALLWLLIAAAACTASPGVLEPTPTPTSPEPSTPAPVSSSPSPGGVRTYAVFGDWGAATAEQAAIARRMCRVRRAVGFDTVITTGDNFYDPDGTATRENYHEPAACLIEGGVRWRASWGNHDARGDDTGEVLGARRWYRWREGRAHFFMLDSNDPGNEEQKAWLRGALASSQAPVKIAVFHHPPYSVGTVHGDDERVQEHWVPLFERHGVQLVLTGHNHLYEHQVRRGIHYVVTGGGGRSLYGCGDPVPALRRCRSVHHFLLLRIAPARLVIEAIDAEGARIDRFVIDEGD